MSCHTSISTEQLTRVYGIAWDCALSEYDLKYSREKEHYDLRDFKVTPRPGQKLDVSAGAIVNMVLRVTAPLMEEPLEHKIIVDLMPGKNP